MSLAAKERALLAKSFVEFGPHAPTLCAGWQAQDLLEHLIIRERHPLAMLPGNSSYHKRLQAQLRTQDFAELVAQWGKGCYRPFSIRKFGDALLNGVEHWVHHEDLRRAQGLGPRELAEADAEYLASSLKVLRWLIQSSKPVLLESDGFMRVAAAGSNGVVAKGDDVIHVRGPVGEIVLWLFGRPGEVEVIGDTQGLHFRQL